MSRRLWIEFEISRADPVANHAKFATSHLFKPFSSADMFVSMVISHVTRGRRNLASNTIHLMRHVGISAFQTVLLPFVPPEQIKRLNHSSLEVLQNSDLPVMEEISRVFQVIEPVIAEDGHRIHFVSELFDVIRNLHRWNVEVDQSENAGLWKRRTVTYFVFDPISKLFAPSKFCAYVMPAFTRVNTTADCSGQMNLPTYCNLDESDRRFDGHRARNHLRSNLGMLMMSLQENPEISDAFNAWLAKHQSLITIHPSGPKFIVPPDWYW